MTDITASELAQKIDHTLLVPEATPERIDRLCDEALRYGFFAICVNPVYVRRVTSRLDRECQADRALARPVVVSVAGFPLGAGVTETKVLEASRAVEDGATEVDMVVNLGALIAGQSADVRRDIEAVAGAVHGSITGGILKVILEMGSLSAEQAILGCRCAAEGEADFVKTSTGLHPTGGATVEQVRLLCRHASPMGVKASGGIRTASTAIAMIEAGATRIGTASGVAIIRQLQPRTH